MYIVPIAWLYVALMMALAEATASNGTVVGAVITFLFYGVLPISLVVYVMGTPARKRAIKVREETESAAAQAAGALHADPAQTATEAPTSGSAPDAHSEPPTHPVAPVRKET
ncbi:hypothetical protein [Rhodoferax antarcticus]|uniref:hypothetical protein n=1 Tax=Rhodoferax antarcticus TaxID=81479 RepID=UPI00094FD4A9|nr:hypothetical protein [Rhodoferax antarcticus]APW46129.1 hypothetical protein RA876_06795 [Rhodoferax antarcticus]MCW2310295.1 hypothetical protein [Rhodoferax antarcticus]